MSQVGQVQKGAPMNEAVRSKLQRCDESESPSLNLFPITRLYILRKFASRQEYLEFWSPTSSAANNQSAAGIYTVAYSATAKCQVILELYDNFDMETWRPDQEEARVVKIVKEELSLDDSIKPEWYFDLHDPWMPGDPDYP